MGTDFERGKREREPPRLQEGKKEIEVESCVREGERREGKERGWLEKERLQMQPAIEMDSSGGVCMKRTTGKERGQRMARLSWPRADQAASSASKTLLLCKQLAKKKKKTICKGGRD